MHYDWLIVGTGLSGSVFANEAMKHGYNVLLVDKRRHSGGNIYTEEVDGIQVHRYGAHIFHTNDREVWEYINQYAEFNSFINEPLARFGDKVFHLPFNMNTFNAMWGVTTPQEAMAIIVEQQNEILGKPRNLEEQAISMVGRDLYEKLIKGYTEKQWGRAAKDLPADIIKRLPVRFTYDNHYFDDRWQGVPYGGYARIIEKLLEGADVRLNTDFLQKREELSSLADRILFTGTIDSYFHNKYGPLEYRSLLFDTLVYPQQNLQGNAVINFTEETIPYTRIIEHKHFEKDDKKVQALQHTVATYEYPVKWEPGLEPYYPINDEHNDGLYKQYLQLAEQEDNVIFGGRLGSYQYLDMDDAIRAALDLARQVLTR